MKSKSELFKAKQRKKSRELKALREKQSKRLSKTVAHKYAQAIKLKAKETCPHNNIEDGHCTWCAQDMSDYLISREEYLKETSEQVPVGLPTEGGTLEPDT